MTKKRAMLTIIALLAATGTTGVAYAFIHSSTINSWTIRHGLYRGGSMTDRAIQVSTNVATGSCCSGHHLRIALYHNQNRFYDYTCTGSSSCYHNHNGGYAECSYAAANSWYISGFNMSYHRNQDSDYCGT